MIEHWYQQQLKESRFVAPDGERVAPADLRLVAGNRRVQVGPIDNIEAVASHLPRTQMERRRHPRGTQRFHGTAPRDRALDRLLRRIRSMTRALGSSAIYLEAGPRGASWVCVERPLRAYPSGEHGNHDRSAIQATCLEATTETWGSMDVDTCGCFQQEGGIRTYYYEDGDGPYLLTKLAVDEGELLTLA